ncbi:MAG: hypothetical protein KIT14_14030 [bacterium]|nr:hypothetical protein [bacterium]
MALVDDWQLWHTPAGVPFASIPVGDHWEHHPLLSRAARSALARTAYEATGRPPRSAARAEALDVLAGTALFAGPTHDVHVRVAAHGSAVYLDLGDPDWRAVEVTADGWRVVSDPPVRFRRPRALAALPVPVAGTVDALRAVLPVASDDDWHVLVAWLLASLRPRGPYPLLALHGEAGSGKSTAARVLRAVLDPSTVPLRSAPHDDRDLVIAAQHSWVLAVDNVSTVPPWLSDALCRIATGGGYGARELYSDAEEVVLEAQRPVLLTGIEELATRGDLADRTLSVVLPPIADAERRTEAEVWAAVDAMRPGVLGALLDGVACGLRTEAAVQLAHLPRMADAGRWVYAAAPAVGLDPAWVLAIWERQREEAATTTLEASAVGAAVRTLMDDVPMWRGSMAALLAALAAGQPEAVTRDRTRWPQSTQALSGALRRLGSALRAVGIIVATGREAKASRARWVSLCREGRPPRPPRPDLSADGADPGRPRTTLDDLTSSTSSTNEARRPEVLDDLDDMDDVARGSTHCRHCHEPTLNTGDAGPECAPGHGCAGDVEAPR